MAASQSDPNQASYTFAVPSAATLVGGPVVKVTDQVLGSSAELAARLWDLDPAGNQTLITRTVYRFEEGANGSTIVPLSLQLWPNGWQLQCGHSIKLELSQNDQPVWRPNNQQSAMLFTGMQLSLPVVAGSTCTPGQNVAESPLMPLLPVAALLAVGGAALVRRRRLITRV
jgi:MYXO-CTERM domain-containing protein